MAGSYFQTETYGVTAIDLSNVGTTEKFLGSAIGLQSTLASAKKLDLRADRQTYSLKQVFQMIKASQITGTTSLVISLYSKSAETALTAADKVAEFTVGVADVIANGTVGFEVTLPSNCKRYLAIGIKKAADTALTGNVLFVNKPIR